MLYALCGFALFIVGMVAGGMITRWWNRGEVDEAEERLDDALATVDDLMLREMQQELRHAA